MVHVEVVNKVGESTGEWCRQCFGFMSEIDCWDENEEEWDDDLGEWVSNPLDGFASHNLQTMIFHHKAANCISDADRDKVMGGIKEAMSGLPQYYDNVTLENDGKSFHFPLMGVKMQKTIIGAMMLRNIIQYSSNRQTFLMLMESGIDAKLSFIMAQRYQMNHSLMENTKMAYVSNGDETIFGDEARVCDIIAMYNGQLGTMYQGNWGSTREGYGRYGDLDGECAGDNPRTGCPYYLIDTTLVEEGYEDSPMMYNFEHEASGKGSYTIEQLVEIATKLKALM